jgi:uncharacterized protein (DUF1810 family)
MSDPYNLARFVSGQDADGTYDRAITELRGGHKASHWMWFVFPQIAGLGSSPISREYAISSLEEAVAYLRHPILGRRLTECANVLAATEALDAAEIFGCVDAKKLRSSMTLFMRAAPGPSVFERVLDRYFSGMPDEATDERLQMETGRPSTRGGD